MANRFFSRRWDESRADDFDGWGAATYYFEVADGGLPLRQVEVYDSGQVLRYGPDRTEDEFGGLGHAKVDELEDWSQWAISEEVFESHWSDRP